MALLICLFFRKDAVPQNGNAATHPVLFSEAVIEVAFCCSAQARRATAGPAFARGHAT